MIKVFTSINANYVDKAAVLWDSLKVEFFDVEINTFLVEPTLSNEENNHLRNLLKDSCFPGNVYTIYDLPEDWNILLQKKSVVESCTAIKASATNFLLETDTELVIYFDPDIFLYADISDLIIILRENSVSLTPHLLAPPTNDDGILTNEISGSLRFGVFNLGFFAFSNNLESREVVKWWNSRLKKYCESTPEAGIFTDQKWFDLSPAYFPQIKVLRHPGLNVGPWNIENRTLSLVDGVFYCEGELLVFFHFSSFDKPDLLMMLEHFDKSKLSLQLLTGYGKLLDEKKPLKNSIKGRDALGSEADANSEFSAEFKQSFFKNELLIRLKENFPKSLKRFLRRFFLRIVGLFS
jgi:hypothetical protein